MVRWRHAQCRGELRRQACRCRPRRHGCRALRGGARRSPHPHLRRVQDAVTGSAIAAFVVVGDAVLARAHPELVTTLREHVAIQIGPIAKPAHVFAVRELPKTRSGKILRRLLARILDGHPLGDTTSLHDATVPDELANAVRQQNF